MNTNQKLTPRAWWLIPCHQHGPSDHCFALAQGHVDSALCSCRHRRDPDCRVHGSGAPLTLRGYDRTSAVTLTFIPVIFGREVACTNPRCRFTFGKDDHPAGLCPICRIPDHQEEELSE